MIQKYKYEIFISLLLFGFSVERFFIWDNPVRLDLVISGLLGAIFLILSSVFISVKYTGNSNSPSKGIKTILYYLLFELFAVISVFIQFMPLILSNEENYKTYSTFLNDIGIDVHGYRAQFFETLKDILWCSSFSFFVIFIANRVRLKTISYRHVFLIIIIFVSFLIILLPFMVKSTGFHNLFQIEYLLIFFLIFLIIQSSNILELKLNTLGNIFYNKDVFITMSISNEIIKEDVPPDHIEAFMRIFDKVISKYEGSISVLDLGGGSGFIGENILRKYREKIDKYVIVDRSKDSIKMARNRLKHFEGILETEIGDILEYRVQNRYDIVIMNQVIQFFKPDCYKKLFTNIYALMKNEGFLLIVDEFPQQSPEAEDVITLQEKLQIVLALYPVEKEYVISEAEKCNLLKNDEYVERLNRDRYHPPITGLLFRKNILFE